MLIAKVGGSVFAPKTGGAENEFLRNDCQKIINELKEESNLTAVIFGAGAFGHKLAGKLQLSAKDFSLISRKELEPLLVSLNYLKNELIAPLLPQKWQIAFMDSGWVRLDETKQVSVFFAGLEQKDHEDQEFVWVKIISGDEIVARVANSVKAERLLFYTDTAGIALTDGLKSSFMVSELEQVIEKMIYLPNSEHDQTEGMKGKLKALRRIENDIMVEFR